MATAKEKNQPALPRIFAVRKQRVVIDADLARLYGVPTKRLNEAVGRNAKRFPPEFCFQFSREELANLKSQIAISSSGLQPLLDAPAVDESPKSKIGYHQGNC
jgi:hypothetical protein